MQVISSAPVKLAHRRLIARSTNSPQAAAAEGSNRARKRRTPALERLRDLAAALMNCTSIPPIALTAKTLARSCCSRSSNGQECRRSQWAELRLQADEAGHARHSRIIDPLIANAELLGGQLLFECSDAEGLKDGIVIRFWEWTKVVGRRVSRHGEP
jgi:hypothetical protein